MAPEPTIRKKPPIGALVGGVLLVVLSIAAIIIWARPTPGTELATASLHEIEGDVQARSSEESDFAPAKEGKQIEALGQVRTGSDGRVRLDLSDGTSVRIGPNTTFTLEALGRCTTGTFTRLTLLVGDLWVSLSGGQMEVDTPSGVAAVRGSHMSVHAPGGAGVVRITCLSGHCGLSNQAGEVALTAGGAANAINQTTRPAAGYMTAVEVQTWLQVDPEATAVLQPLTATVGARPTATPTPTLTPQPNWSATAGALDTAIPSLTNFLETLTALPSTTELLETVTELLPTITELASFTPPPLPTITFPPITPTIPKLP